VCNTHLSIFASFQQCTVSLVGQWIDEAKSKLKDPGLVYSYHGPGRKRDPCILAQNSIVVTTYETLASDTTYHKNRSKDPDYCPPCEQVRWWRIICDESHVLRNPSGKLDAVIELVGDNKWLVTGESRKRSSTGAFFRISLYKDLSTKVRHSIRVLRT
jgi:SWI/SNF-related matrix-associated actin-dependent regulator of chromatin subfamily A3